MMNEWPFTCMFSSIWPWRATSNVARISCCTLNTWPFLSVSPETKNMTLCTQMHLHFDCTYQTCRSVSLFILNAYYFQSLVGLWWLLRITVPPQTLSTSAPALETVRTSAGDGAPMTYERQRRRRHSFGIWIVTLYTQVSATRCDCDFLWEILVLLCPSFLEHPV